MEGLLFVTRLLLLLSFSLFSTLLGSL
uniref:Uncharacterized protein n=1 Tax=Anguilla anguilla TaxID=7936 RepID=A0A0E9TAY5_ANGAN